jgi:hypothetical protein
MTILFAYGGSIFNVFSFGRKSRLGSGSRERIRLIDSVELRWFSMRCDMDRIRGGTRLRIAVAEERPLQVVGAINAYSALLAQRAGFRALYLSGAGVANASFGLPDLGITSLNDVCEDVRRIAGASELPLLVDADTGWGAAAIARARRWSAPRRWRTASRPRSTAVAMIHS